MSLRSRPHLAAGAAALLLAGLAAQGCGSDTVGFGDPDRNNQGDGGSSGTPPAQSSGGIEPPPDGSSSSGGTDEIQALTIEPAVAEVLVRKVDGVITRTPDSVRFVARRNGVVVDNARWSLQQGELGAIDAQSGEFVASGHHAGEGVVHATANGGAGEARVRITLEAEQNGGTSDGSVVDCGAGGCGGVGGEPLGAAVSADGVERLKNQAPEAGDGGFNWLYPYDKTVFPRGILAPLLQWGGPTQTVAVSVAVRSPGVSFTGFYQYPADATAAARQRVRLDQAIWASALSANDGSQFVEVELKLLGPDNKVYGPFKRQVIVSPAPLTGTVYYNSYNSRLTGEGTPDGELGGVLAIRVTSSDPAIAATPTVALPRRLEGDAAQRKCTGCHTVSADGSSLFVQDGQHDPAPLHLDYPKSMWFDLRQSPADRGDGSATSLDPVATPAHANLFLWSAPYPDGSFVLASRGLTREARSVGTSALFGKDGAAVEAAGLPEDLWASMPSFSPDGRRVAFNFYGGTVPSATAGGRSLVLYDFDCGAAAGQTACAAGTAKTFSQPRVLYSSQNTYPAWPSFFADGQGLVFQNGRGNAGELYREGWSTCTPYNGLPQNGVASQNIGGTTYPLPAAMNCHASTWYGQDSEIWLAPDGGEAMPLYALNGTSPQGQSYLPPHTVAQTANSGYWRTAQPASKNFDDTKLNYQPTVNPVPSGGYYWVVFTSRRRYGNVMNEHPFHRADNGQAVTSNQKKLWVAAVDVSTGAVDRSHPPFYLPGQELRAGNSRGFWVVDPCRNDGSSCETGDQCCGGSCRADDSGALSCQPPPQAECKPEFDACVSDADCCGTRLTCIAGRCAVARPNGPS